MQSTNNQPPAKAGKGRNIPMLAVVTGASSGIGLALIEILVRKGYRVIAVARNAAKLEKAIRSFGENAECLPADVRNLEELKSGLAEKLGGRKIDLVVHAAGILRITPQGANEAEDREACIETNVNGTVNILDSIRTLMAEGGHVTVISSIAALVSLPGGLEAYSASKAAAAICATTCRNEFAKMGVTLTVAYPSIVDTPMILDIEELPAVYRAFKHHTAAKAASSILKDSEKRNAASFTTWSDRFLVRISRLAPKAFGAVVAWWIRRFEKKR